MQNEQRAVQDQDPSEWSRVVGDETGWLTAYVARRVPESALEDVLQDIWLAVWESRDRYEERGQRRAYLRRVANRRIADWFRHAPLVTLDDPLPAATADPDRVAHELAACGVPPDSLLWRRIIDDWSLADLAADFALPLGTVKSRIHYQGRTLRRRLDDWHRSTREDAPPCEHLRRTILGVRPCPTCQEERRVWHLIQTRSHPHRFYQTTYITVQSSLNLWFDCTVRVVRWADDDWGCTRADFGPIRRFRDGRGRDLLGRVRRETLYGRPYWTYSLASPDTLLTHLSQYVQASDAEATGAIRRSRKSIQIPADIHYSEESDGALAIELPRNMTVTRVEPPPHYVARVHGHPLLAWANCAALPNPRVVARFL
jgi:RNA polymerase sigma-70 factor (ECF subfamily)